MAANGNMPEGTHADPRIELQSLSALFLRRDLTEGDIEYSLLEVDGGFVGTVVLYCMGAVSFDGPQRKDPEEAEHWAALAALRQFARVGQLAIRHLAAKMPEGLAKPKVAAKVSAALAQKRRFEETDPYHAADQAALAALKATPKAAPPRIAGGYGRQQMLVKGEVGLLQPAGMVQEETWGPVAPAVAPSTAEIKSPKNWLNEFLGRRLTRPLRKDDMMFTVQQLPNNLFVAILQLPALQGMEDQAFQGAPAVKRKDAEASAAAVACQALKDLGFAGPVANEPARQPVLVPPRIEPRMPVLIPPRKKQKFLEPAGAVPLDQSSETAGAEPAPSPTSAEGVAQQFEQWQEERLMEVPEGMEPDAQATSLDLWFGQVCLLCMVTCAKVSWESHSTGKKHLQKYKERPLMLRPELTRPPTEPTCSLSEAEEFVELGGWATHDENAGGHPAVLVVGEMDFSFSLAVAKLRPEGAPLVATSYLAAHDPDEIEVHPHDDGERAVYQRRSLPSMEGALQENLAGLAELKAEVLHGVDATDLDGTLRPQGVSGGFHIVVFPFPRATLQRACDPRNSRLLRGFFDSVLQQGLLVEGGLVQLIMLGPQYEEWDVAGMAAAAGLELAGRAKLPSQFYQAREMSGKPWKPVGAELLCFVAAQEVLAAEVAEEVAAEEEEAPQPAEEAPQLQPTKQEE